MAKTIFITGASSGIGQACAIRFAQQAHNLIICGRRAERLAALQQQLLADHPGIQVLCLAFDIRNIEQCKQAVEQCVQLGFSEIDILVNNAGLAAGLSSIDNGDLADWETMIDTNLKGLLYISKQIMPLMREQKNGHIINIGSIAGKYVYANGNVYCATKHAVVALSESMRIDLLPHGIKVTCINPGAVETEFSLVRFKGDQEKAQAVYQGFTPLSANDVADAVLYSASLPTHVCINEITLTCLTQANSHYSIKSEK